MPQSPWIRWRPHQENDQYCFSVVSTASKLSFLRTPCQTTLLLHDNCMCTQAGTTDSTRMMLGMSSVPFPAKHHGLSCCSDRKPYKMQQTEFPWNCEEGHTKQKEEFLSPPSFVLLLISAFLLEFLTFQGFFSIKLIFLLFGQETSPKSSIY